MAEQFALWGEEFELSYSPTDDKQVLQKINNPKVVRKASIETQIKSSKLSDREKLVYINQIVLEVLGKYKKDTLVIKDKSELIKYIDAAIAVGEIAIDTETNHSLDPLTCKLMGPCIYVPGLKQAYIPLNHVDINDNRLAWQLTEDDMLEQFSRLTENNVKIIGHNAKFDYQVLKCTTRYKSNWYWDTMIAARLLNENERAGLKEQYRSKFDPVQEKYNIEDLFGKIPYEIVDPDIFALYAATDPYITYKLYERQKIQFSMSKNKSLFSLFMEVEMPLVEVTAEMELAGVCINKDYAERLQKKFNQKKEEKDAEITAEIAKYAEKIAEWRSDPEVLKRVPSVDKNGNKQYDANGNLKYKKSKAEQLKDPIEITSPTQLAILLYDIMGVKEGINPKANPRSTDEDTLKIIRDECGIKLCDLILERRSLGVLISTFIEKLPNKINKADGRLHGHFDQLGTDTGRFSSKDPNLQNIPAGEHSIRLMFTASEGMVMIGSDFSSQEPRLMAEYSKDKYLLQSLAEGKDPYATIATKVYKNNYEDNLEHHADGTLYPEGSKRRKSVKGLLLGILYGMGVPAIAERLNVSKDEAQQILDDFYDGFPGVKRWMDETSFGASQNAYVEDFWGRKRRLTDLLLADFRAEGKRLDHKSAPEFNPLLGCKQFISSEQNMKDLKYYCNVAREWSFYPAGKVQSKVENARLKAEAEKKDVHFVNNGAFKSRAQRQSVNARIQGGAATMTKKAMLAVYNDPEMQRLGFKLLLAIHDELIGECPEENAEQAKERLSYLMAMSAKPTVNVQMKCDAEIFPAWYYDVYSVDIQREYQQYLKDNPSDAFGKLVTNHIEFTEDQLCDIIKNVA